MAKKISLLVLFCCFVGVLHADEHKYFATYAELTDEEKVEIFDAIQTYGGGYDQRKQNCNPKYTYFEVNTRLNALEAGGKVKLKSIQKLKKTGSWKIETEEFNPLPIDFFCIEEK